MSKPPSIRAVIKRLLKEAANNQSISVETHQDINLACAALIYIADNAEHTDSADGNPIYTVRLNADWRAKGFLEAMNEALENGKNEKEDDET